MGDNGTVRFLSGEWLEGLAGALAGASPDLRLSIHQRVTGGPAGDVEYTIRLDAGRASVEPGPGQADVELVEDYDTAAAINQGHLSPAAAFAAGKLTLGGAVGALVANQESITALGPRLAALAEATTY
jgi:hypothetical protein